MKPVEVGVFVIGTTSNISRAQVSDPVTKADTLLFVASQHGNVQSIKIATS